MVWAPEVPIYYYTHTHTHTHTHTTYPHLPAYVGVPSSQDVLGERRRLQLVLVKGKLLHQHRGHV